MTKIKKIFFGRVGKLKYVFKTKKDFSVPKQKPILIFDECGSENFLKYFKDDNINILHLRGESINILSLLLAVFSLKASIRGYINSYIKLTTPKIVITFIDNKFAFHRIKSDNPSVTTIFIQNGIRDGSSLSFLSDRNRVDYMLVFGESIGRRYASCLDGKYIAIGSFKLNYIAKNLTIQHVKNKQKQIKFVSQYRKHFNENNIMHDKTTYSDFYKSEKKILSMLLNYTLAKNISLSIIGSGFGHDDSEYLFYKNIFGSCEGWKMENRIDIYSSYYSVSETDIVVSIDSTLGLEGFAMGKRSAFFATRSKHVANKNRTFLPGCGFPKKGEFWTDEVSEEEFERVMSFVVNSSDDVWQSTVDKYKDDIMVYDLGNRKFISLMKELKVPLKDEFYD